MKIKNGEIFLRKKEQLAIQTFLQHAKIDLSWKESGTYGDGENLNKKDYELATEGLWGVEKILELLVSNSKY